MTTLRITGQEAEINRIYELIRPALPEILERQDYDQRGGDKAIYLTLVEPLQADSFGKLQDWQIIEYCRDWRSTPEIKKYFKLEYEQVREICDRLYCCGALSRRLGDKSYEYLDRGLLHKCSECSHFVRVSTEDYPGDSYDEMMMRICIEEDELIGKCVCNNPDCELFYRTGPYRKDKPIQCRDFDPAQKTII